MRFPFVRSKAAKANEAPSDEKAAPDVGTRTASDVERDEIFAEERGSAGLDAALDVSLDADPARVDSLWTPSASEAAARDQASATAEDGPRDDEADDFTAAQELFPDGADADESDADESDADMGGDDRVAVGGDSRSAASAGTSEVGPPGETQADDGSAEAQNGGGSIAAGAPAPSGAKPSGRSVEASAATLAADALRGDSLKEALAQSLADTLAETLAKTLVAIEDEGGFMDKAADEGGAARHEPPASRAAPEPPAASGRPIFEAIMPTVSFGDDEVVASSEPSGPDDADPAVEAESAAATISLSGAGSDELAVGEAIDGAAAPVRDHRFEDFTVEGGDTATGAPSPIESAADATSSGVETFDPFENENEIWDEDEAGSEPQQLGVGLVRAVARAREAAAAYRDEERVGEQNALKTEQEIDPLTTVDHQTSVDAGADYIDRGLPGFDVDEAFGDADANDLMVDSAAEAPLRPGDAPDPVAFDALADASDEEEDEFDAEEAGQASAAPSIEEQSRMVEAMLFASETPLSTAELGARMPVGCDPAVAVRRLEQFYESRGVRVVRVAGKWAFRTAPDLAYLMTTESVEQRKLSKAAIETLAIIAYHQPVTRAEIEEIRQVSVSKGTVDLLMELEWIKLGRRRQSPGRPVTFITTEKFLDHFGLENTKDLPGLDELRQAGLLDNRPAIGPNPVDGEALDVELDEDDDEEDETDERELFV